MKHLSEEEEQCVEAWINTLPRRILAYEDPSGMHRCFLENSSVIIFDSVVPSCPI